ncbi:MAG: nuclear transport factor 2 family protein [Nitrospirota bacterium]
MRAVMLAAAMMIAGTATPAAGADARQLEENKRFVREFYETAINRKDADGAMKYLGSRYIQHNQNAEDGAEGLKKVILFLREKHPKAHSEVKRIFAEGDYVILHVHAVRDPGSRGMAVIDIFRLEQGKIVEHWDVHEDISERPANANGMF